MGSFFHVLKGRYNVRDKFVGVDFAKLFLNPQDAEATLVHEIVHAAIANYDFGQATQNFFYALDFFEHLSEEEKSKMVTSLMQSQDFVQEGMATFMQVNHLRGNIGNKAALEWVYNSLPPGYLSRLKEFEFAFGLSKSYRDHLTGKFGFIAMETGLRKVAPSINLFRSVDDLSEYLSQANNNPDERIKKLLVKASVNPWIVTKSMEEIAKASGITFYPAATKEEVANFLNYMQELSGRSKRFTAEDIGDTPQGAPGLVEIAEKAVIANMNFNLPETAESIFNLSDFLFYGDVLEILFISPNFSTGVERERFRILIGDEPEVNILGLTKTGEKYTTVVSRKKALSVINNTLSKTTLIIKNGGFDYTENRMVLDSDLRSANLIVHNHTYTVSTMIRKLLDKNSNLKFRHFYMGASENHPFQTLVIEVEGQEPIHVVNAFGNKNIISILKMIEVHTRIFSKNELLIRKKHLNNFFSWMGLPWKFDWVESMIDGKNVYYRN